MVKRIQREGKTSSFKLTMDDMNDYVKTPLNYTGNKYRLLSQMQEHFPKRINVMVDLFCGGATVGLNTDCNEVYFVDNEPRVIGLLSFFKKQRFDELLSKIERVVDFYGLSNSYRNGYDYYKSLITDKNKNNGLKEYNGEGFYKLRKYYNELEDKDSDEANVLLYILLLYGFNNDLRFNAKGEYNLPVGKTDLNKTNVLKLKKYLEKVKAIKTHYVCESFNSKKTYEIIKKADFIYIDPPYLVSDATYNENNKWNEEKEKELIELLKNLTIQKKAFVLSNVLSKKGKINEPLDEYLKNNANDVKVVRLDYSYRSSSYNKINRDANEEEIIVLNF